MHRDRSVRRAIVWSLLAVACLAVPQLALAADSKVTGRVIDADSQKPIAGADVELTNASGGPGYFRAKTGRNGEFSLDGIASERYYNLSVGADGYADFVLGGWRFPTAQRSIEVVVPLDRAGSIEVRVTRADGKTPVTGARVAVRSESPSPWWEGFRPPPAPVYADAKGVARFTGLVAGYWTVTAEANGLLANETRRVAVRRGETTPAPLKLTVPAGIAGVVRLADGSPVVGVAVTARGPAEGVGTTGAAGDFTIGDLPPGRYRLDVQQDGFEPARTREAIALAEGEQQGGVTLTVKPRAPELAWVLEREVFAPEEPLKVGLRTFRLGTLTLALWQIPNERLLDAARDFRAYATSADTAGLVRVRTWSHQPPDGPLFTWREEELAITPELPPGAYVLAGGAGGVERRTLFFVSDLGLLVKRSAGRLVVSAASLKTGRAIPGAAVMLAERGGSEGRGEGRDWADAIRAARTRNEVTNDDGLLQLALPTRSSRIRVVAVSEKNGVAVAESPLAAAAEQGGSQVYLYTERPIYRPGQTVYWKLFARKGVDGGYAMPDATRATLTLSGPQGATVDVPAATVSARGSADGAIALTPDLPLGDWTLSASVGSASSSATVAIEEYRKREFRVDVTPDREVYVNGDEVRFTVAASYFFGAPVFGAAVRYNLFESRIQRGDDDEDYEVQDVGYGRVLKTGEARTDVDGRAALVFTPERVSYDRRLTLEVEVVDASNRQVRSRGSAIVGRGLFTIAIEPTNRLVLVGTAVTAQVRTRDHAGKPVSAAVTIELDQDAWNPLERRYTRSSRPLASTVVTTNAQGMALVTLSPQPARSGNLVIRGRAEDAKGNKITDETSVWVYDPSVWQYAYRYPSLEAFADRERYQPGDTAKIVVNTEVGYASVLATVEGREIADVQVVHLFGNTGLVRVPIRREYAPNVYVALHVRKGKEVLSKTLDLAVTGEKRDLTIELKPDREQYRPGEPGTVAIQTKDGAGKPVPAEVSVGIVDEAIYSLREDRTPHPRDVFYGHRPNWVTTVVSFPLLYYGGADKSGREEVRRDFRDVALWQPTVVTDDQGRGSVSVRYPDNLTTWRITSRGMTADTRVGQAVAKTLVTKEVVARLAVPRFLIAGDAGALVSVVTNRTKSPLVGVEESIEASGAARVTGTAHAKSDVPASGESRHKWEFEAPKDVANVARDTLEAAFLFRARSKADTDALEQRVPVQPRAVPLTLGGAGIVESATATVPVELPVDLVRPGSGLTLELSPSPAAMLLAASDALVAYPWACTEQTANALRPGLAMLAAFKQAGVTPPGWEDPKKKLEPFLARLVALQNGEGAWGWWRETDSDPYLTVLALDALARAESSGVATDASSQALQTGAYNVPRMLDEARTVDGEAYCLAHLTALVQLKNANDRFPELRARVDALALSVYSQRDKLGTAALALATRAHAELGRAAEAKALLALLDQQAAKDAAGTHWPRDPETGWWGDDQENTGYALDAIVAVNPQDTRARAIVRWLASRRRGAFWRSTRTTAPVAIALAHYLEHNSGELKPNYTLRVEWNGERVLDRAVAPADALGSGLDVRVLGSHMKPGNNRFVITKQGAGVLYWSWSARALVPSPGPPAARGAALAVTRELLHAELTSDRRGRPRYLTTALQAGESFKVGDLVMVRLRLRAIRPLDYLIVEDPHAAGFEVDNALPEGVERPWDMHAEQRDDRAVFFLTHVGQGETVVEYLVRPEMAGQLTALPASASGMYEPELVARSAEARLEVVAK